LKMNELLRRSVYLWCTALSERTSGSRLQASAKSASHCSCRERTHGAKCLSVILALWYLRSRLARWALQYEAIQRRMRRGGDVHVHSERLQVRELAQWRLSAPHHAFELSSSAPEEKVLCDFWRCFQRR